MRRGPVDRGFDHERVAYATDVTAPDEIDQRGCKDEEGYHRVG